MPAGNRTGPVGMGPMTGRGMGYCAGYNAPGWAEPGPGRPAYGRGEMGGPGFAGGGRRWRHWYYATGLPGWARWGAPPAETAGASLAGPSREQELEMLRQEAQWLQGQMEAVNKRLEELNQE